MRATEAPVSAATVPLLVAAVNDPNGSLARIADVVAGDAGLAARVLALANSAAFGLARQVTEIRMAVSMVGANTAQTLAIAGSTSLLDGAHGLPHAREHAIRVACASRMLAERSGLSKPDAFAAGLLHDLGEILLWRQDPETYATSHAGWSDAGEQLRGERGLYGTDHALVAREQLAEWQLPGVVVDAVGDHHRPDLCHLDLSTAVAAAEHLAERDGSHTSQLAVFGIEPDDLAELRSRLDWQEVELTGLLAAR